MAAQRDPDKERRFTLLVSRYGPSVQRLCAANLKNLADAQDAAQDTFLKAWAALDRFEGRDGASEKTWLMRIAVNVCHDYLRSSWFRHTDLTRAIADLPQRYLTVPPQDSTLTLEVLRLKEPLRQAILLYYYEDMTLAQVAEALNLSVAAVHKRLRKAEQLLKHHLTGGMDDEEPAHQAGA